MIDAVKPPAFVVFSDLDGTLLDHGSYSWAAAQPALRLMVQKGIPLVLASSKTGGEIAVLRAQMGFTHCPAIVENGAGLLAANETAKPSGADYRRIRAALDDLPRDLRQHFTGFGDMGPEGVARDAGLAPDAARAACARAFSEPGTWSGSPEDERAFLAALAPRGITGRRGGRYLTLSFGGTKADRMDTIAAGFGAQRTVALGDAPNDVEMLEHASTGFVIANPHATPLPPLPGEAEGRIRRSTKIGPTGWTEMLLPLLSEID